MWCAASFLPNYLISCSKSRNNSLWKNSSMVMPRPSHNFLMVEMVELPGHPWFVAGQFHPELKSRPNRAHPLFRGFVGAAKAYQK